MDGELDQIFEDLRKYIMGKTSESVQSTLNPMIQNMLKNMDIDFSQIEGMTGAQASIDPYRIIGLDKSASDEEVRQRYRELIRLLHPDTSGTRGTEQLFQMVMAAFQLISKERGWQ